MNILVSNDDGYQAPGLRILAARLREVATVTVVAPIVIAVGQVTH